MPDELNKLIPQFDEQEEENERKRQQDLEDARRAGEKVGALLRDKQELENSEARYYGSKTQELMSDPMYRDLVPNHGTEPLASPGNFGSYMQGVTFDKPWFGVYGQGLEPQTGWEKGLKLSGNVSTIVASYLALRYPFGVIGTQAAGMGVSEALTSLMVESGAGVTLDTIYGGFITPDEKIETTIGLALLGVAVDAVLPGVNPKTFIDLATSAGS